jgi:hypothetical protein
MTTLNAKATRMNDDSTQHSATVLGQNNTKRKCESNPYNTTAFETQHQ